MRKRGIKDEEEAIKEEEREESKKKRTQRGREESKMKRESFMFFIFSQLQKAKKTTMTFTRTSFVALSMLTLCCLALLSPAAASMNFIMDSIFVGDQHAAGNIPYLQSNNVSAILNVAWDLDIQYPTPYYVGNMADNDEHLVLQYSKVGLVDGTGNQPGSLIAAMFALHQFLEPRVLESKDQGTFPQPGILPPSLPPSSGFSKLTSIRLCAQCKTCWSTATLAKAEV